MSLLLFTSSPTARTVGEFAFGLHSTIRAAALLVVRLCRPTNLDTPRRPFVRTSFGDTGLSLPDRPSCGLTRQAPFGVPFSSCNGLRSRVLGFPPGFSDSGRCRRRRRLGLGPPRSLVAQHGPTTYQQLARQRHDRLLLARLAPTQPQVHGPRP